MHSVASKIIHALSGRNGVCRCPVHDDRRPSLSVKDAADGDVVVHCFAGCDYRDIKDELRHRGLLPGWQRSEIDPERQAHIAAERRKRDAELLEKDRQRREWCRSVWKESQEAQNTPVQAYLKSRGIGMAPRAIRFHKALKHTDTGLYYGAMVAAVVRWPSCEILGIHRTFLLPGGVGKAQVSSPKKMAGKCAGGAVQLAPAGETLAISEGIETGLSVQQATGIPTWAALSTSGIKALILPALPIAGEVTIATDHDISGQGQIAAEIAAERWSLEGRKVRIALPSTPGTDFNDLLLEGGLSL
jgi:putative DNA primase/helicase